MKLFFLSAFIFVVCGKNMEAQTARIIDLGVRILNPLPLATFYSPTNLDVTYSLFNKGKDTIRAYDTFITRGENITTYPVQFNRVNQTIAPNDSIILHYIMPISVTGQNDYFWIQLIVSVYSWGADSIRGETFEMFKDNISRVRLYQKYTSKLHTINDESSLFMFPNPVNNVLHIEGLSNAANILLRIYDLQGRMTKEININNVNDNYQLDVSDLPAGIYFLKLKDNMDKFKVVKFVKE